MPEKMNTPSEQRRGLLRMCNYMLSSLHREDANIYEQMAICIYSAYCMIDGLEGVSMMPTIESIHDKLKVIA